MSAADCGLSDVAGTAAGASPGDAGADVPSADSSPGGEKVSLLKLYANGFLQRAEGAQFFGSDQRERAPG